MDETTSLARANEARELVVAEPDEEVQQFTSAQIADHADRDDIDLIVSKEYVPAKEATAAISIRHRVGVRDDYINVITEELRVSGATTTAEAPLLHTDQKESMDVAVEIAVTEATIVELSETNVILPTKQEADREELEMVDVTRFSPEITAPVDRVDVQFSDEREAYGRSTSSAFHLTRL